MGGSNMGVKEYLPGSYEDFVNWVARNTYADDEAGLKVACDIAKFLYDVSIWQAAKDVERRRAAL